MKKISLSHPLLSFLPFPLSKLIFSLRGFFFFFADPQLLPPRFHLKKNFLLITISMLLFSKSYSGGKGKKTKKKNDIGKKIYYASSNNDHKKEKLCKKFFPYQEGKKVICCFIYIFISSPLNTFLVFPPSKLCNLATAFNKSRARRHLMASVHYCTTSVITLKKSVGRHKIVI